MKNLIPFGGLLIALLCVVSCGEKQDVSTYCEAMANVSQPNDKFAQDLNAALLTGEIGQAEIVQQDWLTDLQFQIKGASSVGNFKGDSSLVVFYRTGIADIAKLVEQEYDVILAGLQNEELTQEVLEAEIIKIGQNYVHIDRKLKQENLAFKTKYAKGKK